MSEKGARRLMAREGRIVVGSRRQEASTLPIPVPWLSHVPGKSASRGLAALPLPADLTSPPRKARGSQEWGAEFRVIASPHPNSGPTAAGHGAAADGITRALGTDRGVECNKGASGGSSWLFKV